MSGPPPIVVRDLRFDDPALPAAWHALLAASHVRPPSQTLDFLRLWAATYPVEQLLLLAAEREGAIVAVAPLYATGGMVFFLGVGEADYHDFVGDVGDPAVLAALLAAARDRTEDFSGFKLHFIPEASPTTAALEAAADLLGLAHHHMGDMVTVVVDVAADPEGLRRAVNRSMRKREGWFLKQGEIREEPLETAAAVGPWLPEFYDLHAERWQAKGEESTFARPEARAFLERWVEVSAARGWLHALRLEWQGRTLGMEFAWRFGGSQYCGQWVFPGELARRSPGQVLQRHSVLLAIDAGVRVYDQGLGDQPYKFRLPNRTVTCPTWGLFERSPPSSPG